MQEYEDIFNSEDVLQDTNEHYPELFPDKDKFQFMFDLGGFNDDGNYIKKAEYIKCLRRKLSLLLGKHNFRLVLWRNGIKSRLFYEYDTKNPINYEFNREFFNARKVETLNHLSVEFNLNINDLRRWVLLTYTLSKFIYDHIYIKTRYITLWILKDYQGIVSRIWELSTDCSKILNNPYEILNINESIVRDNKSITYLYTNLYKQVTGNNIEYSDVIRMLEHLHTQIRLNMHKYKKRLTLENYA